MGYQLVPDDISNTISLLIVLLATYYAIKIVRLSDRFEFVALKGGKAPYYIVAGLVCLELDRFLDLFTGALTRAFGYPITATLNDPPAAVSAFFVFLGLREMYTVYIDKSKKRKLPLSTNEIWQVEQSQISPA